MPEKREFGPDTKAEIELFGRRAEERILAGDELIFDEAERVWLRDLAMKRGVNFAGFTSGTLTTGELRIDLKKDGDMGRRIKTLSAQTTFVEEALGGRDGLINFSQTVLKNLASPQAQETLAGFAAYYFSGHTDEDGVVVFDAGGEYFKCRLEAIVSATHRIMRILCAKDEVEAADLQTDKYTLKFLRERVMRGNEKSGVKPSAKIRSDEKIIRSLSVGGIEAILEVLLAV